VVDPDVRIVIFLDLVHDEDWVFDFVLLFLNGLNCGGFDTTRGRSHDDESFLQKPQEAVLRKCDLKLAILRRLLEVSFLFFCVISKLEDSVIISVRAFKDHYHFRQINIVRVEYIRSRNFGRERSCLSSLLLSSSFYGRQISSQLLSNLPKCKTHYFGAFGGLSIASFLCCVITFLFFRWVNCQSCVFNVSP